LALLRNAAGAPLFRVVYVGHDASPTAPRDPMAARRHGRRSSFLLARRRDRRRVATIGGIAAVILAAFGYMRLAARDATAIHALGVGIFWLVLAIAVEMAIRAGGGLRWFELLGSPAHPALRNLFLFAWIFAPALFARQPESA
jgi:hypothetical protein